MREVGGFMNRLLYLYPSAKNCCFLPLITTRKYSNKDEG